MPDKILSLVNRYKQIVNINITEMIPGLPKRELDDTFHRIVKIWIDGLEIKTYAICFSGSYTRPFNFKDDLIDNRPQLSGYEDFAREVSLEYKGSEESEMEHIWVGSQEDELGKRFKYANGYHKFERSIKSIINENKFARDYVLEIMYKNHHKHSQYGMSDIIKLSCLTDASARTALYYLETEGYIKVNMESGGSKYYVLTSKGYEEYERKYGYYERTVFLIISCNLNKIIDEVYRPIIEDEFGLKLKIQERSEPEGMIHLDIYEYIKNSMFCICDLTEKRPNCIYELGYAHAKDRKVIITISEKDALDKNGEFSPPFDISPYKHTIIKEEEIEKFKEELRQRITDTIAMIEK